jgi:hypothetical protein
MSDQAQETSRGEFDAAVRAKAKEDPAFRKRLLERPADALREAFQVEMPAGVEIHVLEETPAHLYLVLPMIAEALSDAELSQVAGGTGARFGRIWRLN